MFPEFYLYLSTKYVACCILFVWPLHHCDVGTACGIGVVVEKLEACRAIHNCICLRILIRTNELALWQLNYLHFVGPPSKRFLASVPRCVYSL